MYTMNRKVEKAVNIHTHEVGKVLSQTRHFYNLLFLIVIEDVGEFNSLPTLSVRDILLETF